MAGCAESEDGIQPQISDITESVYASVTVEPKNLYNVYPSVPGILDTLLVSEGDSVVKGQVLARIVSESPELAKRNAELNFDLASEKYKGQANALATIEKEISLARDQLRLDSLNFQRQKKLWDQNIGSQNDFENRKLKYDQSRNRLAVLEQQYEQTQTELKNAYRQSQNALAQAESKLQDYLIRSRLDGKVYSIKKEEGEFILSQEVLAQIGLAEAFVIEMAVDEVDIASIEIGQKAIVALDAYEDKVFNADVSMIYPQKDERSQTFKVEALFQNLPDVLYSGLAGEANIIIRTKEDALTIPINYLKEGNKVETADGTAEVKTGLRSLERIEILSGLDTTDIILKP